MMKVFLAVLVMMMGLQQASAQSFWGSDASEEKKPKEDKGNVWGSGEKEEKKEDKGNVWGSGEKEEKKAEEKKEDKGNVWGTGAKDE